MLPESRIKQPHPRAAEEEETRAVESGPELVAFDDVRLRVGREDVGAARVVGRPDQIYSFGKRLLLLGARAMPKI